jgi:hypothetical protein
MRVNTKPPHQKQNNIPQYKRYQTCFHSKGYYEHSPRCLKCRKSHNTEQYTLPKTQPTTCLHCEESRSASYRGCKVYQEIIRIRFSSPRLTASIYITNTPKQESASSATYRKLKDDRKLHTPKQPEIVLKHQQS